MISGALPRGLAVIEALAHHPNGLTLATLCDKVDIPKAAVFRALSDLTDASYVRQRESDGAYMLSIRFPALALKYLSRTDTVDLARPIIKRLAEQSQEHVRLALVESNKLVFMAHEEGSRSALRFNTEAGVEPHLYYTATGLAWLSGFTDEKAMELVSQQGIGDPTQHGPNAPSSVGEFLQRLNQTRIDGYAIVEESNEIGVSGIAVPVHDGADSQHITCVLTIPGPSPRLSRKRMMDLLPLLQQASEELGEVFPGIR